MRELYKHMRRVSPIFAKCIEVLPMAICLAIGESLYIWLHVALHRGMPAYWLTLPITWPANLILSIVSEAYVPEEFIVVLIFFGLLLNSLILILLLKGFRRWLLVSIGADGKKMTTGDKEDSVNGVRHE